MTAELSDKELVERARDAANAAGMLLSKPPQPSPTMSLLDALASRLEALSAENTRLVKVRDIAADNIKAGWDALRMIREAVETLGPVGALPSEEHIACAIAPTPQAEAEAIIAGIQKIEAALSEAQAREARLREGVTVKPLEWLELNDMQHTAESPFGRYRVYIDGTWHSDKSEGAETNIAAARTSAQADYEARVRALTTKGAGE